ncbi:MAG TPA: bifunctional diguanylate cyclase/phosphodiesterase, partial [Noviherbaspirillum sp.]|nr:bifunctional diguanylate cyclase/phosphodiesterase [Noviherbaspirillum sp.]
ALAARLGGDEFTVLLDDPPGRREAEALGERLMSVLAMPFQIEGQEMFVTASIGAARFPEDGDDAASLLKNADVAMYRVKQRGRNNFQFFTRDMNGAGLEQLMLENGLRRALERGEFELHYQPQMCTRTGRIGGVEALIRWRRPEVGLVPPGAFIGLAEQNGLIMTIGAWVLREACRQAKEWLDQGFEFGRVAVNLSARQFESGDLLQTIRDALYVTGLPPTRLELEITESIIMRNPQEAIGVLERVRDLGIAIAVDDFGTGYSSLASLKQYPLDRLKIDRSFISGIPEDADDIAITEAIVAVGHKMGLELVAEGVETAAQRDFLRKAGCDFAQGYLLGRPVLPEALQERLAQVAGPASAA